MRNVSENPTRDTHPMVDPIERVTPEERRKVLEAMVGAPEPDRALNEAVLSVLGAAAVEPSGERFAGEDVALAALLDERSPQFAFAERILFQAALEVWSCGCTGSRASRTALLRGLGAFLLNDVANRTACESRESVEAP